jgi:hypothetical protein
LCEAEFEGEESGGVSAAVYRPSCGDGLGCAGDARDDAEQCDKKLHQGAIEHGGLWPLSYKDIFSQRGEVTQSLCNMAAWFFGCQKKNPDIFLPHDTAKMLRSDVWAVEHAVHCLALHYTREITGTPQGLGRGRNILPRVCRREKIQKKTVDERGSEDAGVEFGVITSIDSRARVARITRITPTRAVAAQCRKSLLRVYFQRPILMDRTVFLLLLFWQYCIISFNSSVTRHTEFF